VDVKKLIYQGYKSTEACEKLGISPDSYRRWRDKLAANPERVKQEEIHDDSRRPKRLARQVSVSTRQRVIEVANQPQYKSANRITQQLKVEDIAIGTAKVIEILEEEGLYGEIQIKDASGEYKRKRGLLRQCEKRQQAP